MKKLLLLILFCFVQNIFAQGLPPLPKAGSYTTEAPVGLTPSKSVNDDVIDDNIYDKHVLESQPEFPGGNDAFKLFVKENYKNTDPASPKGKVYASFVVEKDGSLSSIKILRDIEYGSGAEVIRILKKSPKWIPGKQNGKNLRAQNTIIVFIE